MLESELNALQNTFTLFRDLLPNESSVKGDDGHESDSGHRGEEGRWTEELISEFLRRHLPSTVTVATGFVYNPKTGHRSNQLDIIVYDSLHYVPTLRYGNAMVIESDAVIAVLSVKYTLYSADVKKELEALQRVAMICGNHRRLSPYTALLGFRKSPRVSYSTWKNNVCNSFQEWFDLQAKRKEKLSAGEIVDTVVTLDGFLLHSSSPKSANEQKKERRKSVKAFWGDFGPATKKDETTHRGYVLLLELLAGIYLRIEDKFGTSPTHLVKLDRTALKPFCKISVCCEARPPRLEKQAKYKPHEAAAPLGVELS